ncbi:MFS transporter [Rhodococcus fascians]|nr:MFS transporter [Rhodococcus fascians]MBY4238707.1 MFS transporter [Rhodococcus fascians]MBY4254704.1 MFS transporter [Rhodococcus fascians]MBY4270062.1 MFS transporter [Rhodococcus fascians]
MPATDQQSLRTTGRWSQRASVHPRALYTIGVFEVLERFSYFGMLTILVYYIYFTTDQGGLGMPQNAATAIVGGYGGIIYLSTIAGGWIADRVLGNERTLVVGAIVVLAGHISLALLPGIVGLVAGLAFVAVGSGAIKTSTGTIIGTLYEAKDPRREIGFTIYYVSISLGSLFGATTTAFLQKNWGFHAGFGSAAVGMAVGLAIYLTARRSQSLTDDAIMASNPASTGTVVRAVLIVSALIAAAVALIGSGVVDVSQSAGLVAVLAAAVGVGYLISILKSAKVTSADKKRVIGYLPIFGASTLVVMFFLQLYTSVSVHADIHTNRQVFGWELPPSTAIAIGPIFTLALFPVVSLLWKRLGSRQPSVVGKYAIALLIMCVGYSLLGAFSISPADSTPILVVLIVVLCFYAADLVAAPSGVSTVTALAPPAYKSQLLSVHYLSFSIAAALSGVAAQYYPTDSEASVGGFFWANAALGLGAALVLVIMRRPICRAMALESK